MWVGQFSPSKWVKNPALLTTFRQNMLPHCPHCQKHVSVTRRQIILHCVRICFFRRQIILPVTDQLVKHIMAQTVMNSCKHTQLGVSAKDVQNRTLSLEHNCSVCLWFQLLCLAPAANPLVPLASTPKPATVVSASRKKHEPVKQWLTI